MIESSISPEIRILDPKVREHVDTFRVLLLSQCAKTVFPELLEIFGIEAVLKFLDIFGGLVVKVPDRSFLEDAVRDVDVYHTLSKTTDPEASEDFLAIKYDTDPGFIRDCFRRVQETRQKYGL
jgi:hypothetical protein